MIHNFQINRISQHTLSCTHTHIINCVFLINRDLKVRARERESRSCCNLEPTLSLSSLCRLSPPIARPATWSTLILRWTWLYDPSLCRLSSESFDYSNPRRYLEIHLSWKTRKQFKLLNLRPLHLCAFALTRSKLYNESETFDNSCLRISVSIPPK